MRIPDPSLPTLVGLLVALVVVVILDVRTRTIPNWLVGAIALAGLLHAALAGGPRALAPSLGGGAAGAAFLLLQWRCALVGGGDLKLLAALGVWLGVLRTFYVLLFGSILGGLLSLAALVALPREERRRVGHNLTGAVLTRDVGTPSELSRRRGVPYGVALAVAAAGVLLLGVGR